MNTDSICTGENVIYAALVLPQRANKRLKETTPNQRLQTNNGKNETMKQRKKAHSKRRIKRKQNQVNQSRSFRVIHTIEDHHTKWHFHLRQLHIWLQFSIFPPVVFTLRRVDVRL